MGCDAPWGRQRPLSTYRMCAPQLLGGWSFGFDPEKWTDFRLECTNRQSSSICYQFANDTIRFPCSWERTLLNLLAFTAVEAFRRQCVGWKTIPNKRSRALTIQQSCRASFSAVQKPICATKVTKHPLSWMFQNLQDVFTFPWLQTHFFRFCNISQIFVDVFFSGFAEKFARNCLEFD